MSKIYVKLRQLNLQALHSALNIGGLLAEIYLLHLLLPSLFSRIPFHSQSNCILHGFHLLLPAGVKQLFCYQHRKGSPTNHLGMDKAYSG